MPRFMNSFTSAALFGVIFCTSAVSGADPQEHHAELMLDGSNARVQGFIKAGRIRRIYGRTFSRGASPEQSATRFLELDAPGALGVTMDDLRAEAAQPIMYEGATGRYKFTGRNYIQHRDGIPVFRSRLTLLIRNEPDHPLVLASSDLRDVGRFQPDRAQLQSGAATGVATARRMFPALDRFSAAEPVIWAGAGDAAAVPTLGYTFIGEDKATEGATSRWLFVTRAPDGEILFLEDQIHAVDIAGNISGIATDGPGADICGPAVPTPLAEAYIAATGASAYSDANGDFVLTDVELPLLVKSRVRGRWFRVFNQSGTDAYIPLTIETPGDIEIVHNEGNPDERRRAEVNAYVHANIVRDYALLHHPDYPVIGDQTQFRVNVNIELDCNATYSGNAINFYTSGSGCPNTAFSSVVYHEYGHHLVNTGGSGQGAYGEGMADSVAVLVSDDPRLGIGFGGSCTQWLRDADNNCRYRASGCSTCGGGAHSCGRVLSGCVWSLREALVETNPEDYRSILSSLTLNSILLHTGSGITPAITIDFLTLDDNNGNILDGTPHYAQIASAFNAHDMTAPELTCPGDLDDSGAVDFGDILLVLAAWGPCDCPEDIDGSGAVTFEEILYLLSQFGPCE